MKLSKEQQYLVQFLLSVAREKIAVEVAKQSTEAIQKQEVLDYITNKVHIEISKILVDYAKSNKL